MRRSFTKYLLLTSAGLFFLFSAFAGTGNTKTPTAQQNNNNNNVFSLESFVDLNTNQPINNNSNQLISASADFSDPAFINYVSMSKKTSMSSLSITEKTKLWNQYQAYLSSKSVKGASGQKGTLLFESFQLGFPSGWVNIDNDGIAPNASALQITGWDIIENPDEVGDSVAVSNSWLASIVPADDYMITSQVMLDGGSTLEWDAKAQDPGFADGYEVRISTTGTAIADFLANPPLFTTAAENSVWTTRTVDLALAGYLNQNVYFAFRNNSTDKFLLLVDDVAVYDAAGVPTGGDASLAGFSPTGSGIAGYTDVPTSQAASNAVSFSMTTTNIGTDSLTGVTLSGTLSPGGSVVTGTLPQLIAGDTSVIMTNAFTATPSTAYTGSFNITSNEPDADTTNNSASVSFNTAAVGDSVYAREDALMGSGNGVGSNTAPLRLGNTYVVNTTDTLSSITVYFQGDPAGKNFELFVADFNGTTDVYNTGNISGLSGTGFYTFSTGGVVLTPGTYIVGINQVQANVNIAVALTTTYQRPGTAFFGSLGSWTDVGSIGIPTLYGAFLIRANFGSPTVTLQGADAALTATPSASGIGFYTQVPQSQANGNNIDFGLVVDNVGTDTLTGINVSGTINPGGSSVNASVTPSLAPGATVAANTNSYTATASTAYTATFNVTSNETDVDTSNNTIAYTFTSASVGDSVYALESSTGGPSVGGIGSTATARIGNVFNVNTTDTVTSITVYLAGDPAGKDFEVFIGDPNGTADIYNSGSITGLSGVGFYTFDVGGVILTPGDYIFGLNQTQTNVNIGLGVETLSQIPGVSLFGNYSGWTDLTILAVPAPIRGNLVVRPNFGTVASPTILSAFALTAPANGTLLDVTGAGTQTVNVTWGASTPTPATTVTYEWLLDVQGGNFNNPLATISTGTATNLVLTYQDIDNLLNSLGVLVGDTAFTSWTVRATAPGAALLATVPFDLDLIRSGLTPANSRDFEAYNPGDLIVANDTEWEFWPNATIDAPVSNVQSQSGTNSLLIDQAPNQDLVFKLGNQTAGVWGAGFSIYIPSGNGAYYNLQETEVPGIRWPIGNVVFDPAGTGTVDGVSPAANFTFPHDQWFDVRNYVDLDNDSFQVWINNSFVAGGVWTAAPPQGGGTSQLQLGGINIFPEGAGGTSPAQKVFYLDDMYFQPDSLRTPVNYVFSPYNLTSPPDQTRLEVEAGDPTPVVIDWEATTTTPAATPNYVWLLDLIGGTFTNPELSLVSDNGGADSQLSLTSGALDVQLSNLGVPVGDSIDRSWTVEASVAGQTAFPANAPYSIRLVRRSPIGFDPSALENNISFFPNPTSDQLVVKVRDNAVNNVEIQSMLGQTLKSFEINNPTNVLDVSGLSSGLYIIRFVSENQEYSQKLIIE